MACLVQNPIHAFVPATLAVAAHTLAPRAGYKTNTLVLCNSTDKKNKLTWPNFIKLFWRNLPHRRIAYSFDRGYAARSVNYAKKVL